MVKIVVTGPVRAGKTTFVHSLSERGTVSTEESATSQIGKSTTTVALDVGFLDVAGGSVKLIGTPGQERFAYMWEILVSGADGVILLIPADYERSVLKAHSIASRIGLKSQLPTVVGITRSKLAGESIEAHVRQTFSSLADSIRRVDARKPEACRTLVASVLRLADEKGGG